MGIFHKNDAVQIIQLVFILLLYYFDITDLVTIYTKRQNTNLEIMEIVTICSNRGVSCDKGGAGCDELYKIVVKE